MNCFYCNNAVNTSYYCDLCNVDYMHQYNGTGYYYIYLVLNNKRYVCKKQLNSNEVSFYIDEYLTINNVWNISNNVILTLDNVNITPSNFKDFVEKKLKTLMVFK